MNPALALGRAKGARAGKLTKTDREQAIRPLNFEARNRLLAVEHPEDVEPRYLAAFAMMAKAGLRPDDWSRGRESNPRPADYEKPQGPYQHARP
jgi:hypothetical protein